MVGVFGPPEKWGGSVKVYSLVDILGIMLVGHALMIEEEPRGVVTVRACVCKRFFCCCLFRFSISVSSTFLVVFFSVC